MEYFSNKSEWEGKNNNSTWFGLWVILDTYLNNSVIQGFCALLKLLPDDEIHLIVSEGAECFGLKFVSVLHNDFSLFEMHCDLTGGKVNICRGGIELYIQI